MVPNGRPLLLLALVACASMAGTAKAAPAGLNHMQQIGRVAFPSACAPVSVVTVAPQSAAGGTFQSIAESDRTSCTLFLSSSFGNWSLADGCSAIVHERKPLRLSPKISVVAMAPSFAGRQDGHIHARGATSAESTDVARSVIY
jgi:hypothetical protein